MSSDRQQSPSELKSRVLVVDAAKSSRTMSVALLRGHSYQAEHGSNAEAIKLLLERERFDLVILQGHPPGMTLQELFEKVQAADPAPMLLAVSDELLESGNFSALTDIHPAARVVHKPHSAYEFVSQVVACLEEVPASSNVVIASEAPSDEEISPVAKLQVKYLAKLPGKLAEISETLSEAEKGDAKALETAVSLAHKVRGTAGTYGVWSVSRLCGEIEDTLGVVADGSRPLGAEIERLRTLLSSAGVEAERSQKAVSDRAPESSSQSIATLRLLLVDDDDEFVETMRAQGAARLIDFTVATDIASAVEMAKTMELDGALLDVRLGSGESGFALAAQLRALEDLQHLPLVFLSAYGDVDNRIAAAHAGALFFLDKPVSESELVMVEQQITEARSQHPARIALVDDDTDFAESIGATLIEAGIEVTLLNDGTALLERLDEIDPELVLLDIDMPTLNGYQVCRIIRATPRWQQVQVGFLTGHHLPAVRIACYQAGADDFITKPVLQDELVARVKSRVRRARQLRHRANNDGLTNLLRRSAFSQQVNFMLSAGARADIPTSLCLIDLDSFKEINDGYGHAAGDSVLAGLGKLLSQRFRLHDVRGRWGGDEFAVALTDADREQATGVMERVLDEFRKLDFRAESGVSRFDFTATFSCGIATFPEDGTCLAELMRAADQCLYAAKLRGRNCVVSDERVRISQAPRY